MKTLIERLQKWFYKTFFPDRYYYEMACRTEAKAAALLARVDEREAAEREAEPESIHKPPERESTLQEETAAAYADAFDRAVEALMRTFEEFADALDALKNLAFDIFNEYPNKRVKHLAIYATKERTRKKNLNRVIKWALNKRSGYGRCMSPQESPR